MRTPLKYMLAALFLLPGIELYSEGNPDGDGLGQIPEKPETVTSGPSLVIQIKILNFTYDGCGNRITRTVTSGSPTIDSGELLDPIGPNDSEPSEGGDL